MNVFRKLKKKNSSKSRERHSSAGFGNCEGTLSSRLCAASGAMGIISILAAILILSVLAGADWSAGPRLYFVGEVADRDVVADREFLVENVEATRQKRRRAAAAQPPVFDLAPDAYEFVDRRVSRIFHVLNTSEGEDVNEVRWRVSEDLNSEVALPIFERWKEESFQNLVLGRVLPWLKGYMAKGVVSDSGAMSRFDSGIMVRNVETGIETLRMDPAAISDRYALRDDLAFYLKKDLHKSLLIRRDIWALIGPLASPSLSFNAQETAARKREVARAVEPAYFHVQQGQIIVRQGEAVSLPQHVKLKAMISDAPETFGFGRAIGLFLVGCLLVGGLRFSSRSGLCTAMTGRDMMLVSLIVLGFGLLAKAMALLGAPLALSAGAWTRDLLPYAMPIAGACGLLALFFSHAICFNIGIVISFLCASIFGGGLPLFLFYFLGCMLQTFLMKQTHTRYQTLYSLVPLLGGLLLAWFGVAFVESRDLLQLGAGTLYVLAGGIASLFIVLALSPAVELILGFTSRFKLMELMNLEQPLLQELMVAAPGTYHHSLVVSNMVEAGARAIGANPLVAKVAALYHDVGKITKPQYFIENQLGRERNRHDKLTPSMSALILISHVKKGVELARQHKLGKEIEDIIQQHHGTNLISYFYHKAKEQAEARGEEDVREEEFRYPGPKPQTKEAGLILLADAIEASSRTLSEPTPSRIKGHIESVIKKIFSDGQLDESELTLKDLHRLSEVFHRILTGIFHQRIEYPSGSQPRTDGQAADSAKELPPAESSSSQQASDASASASASDAAKDSSSSGGSSCDAERSCHDSSVPVTYGYDGYGDTELKFSKSRSVNS